MAGGKRAGAGRPPGAKNKRTKELQRVAATGELPLDYMLAVMRDCQADDRRRDDMAKSAAPYVHARLANIEHTGEDGGPIVVQVVKFADDPHA